MYMITNFAAELQEMKGFITQWYLVLIASSDDLVFCTEDGS